MTGVALLAMLWFVGAMIVVSFLFPAVSAEKAQMTVHPEAFTADWWFLLPMALTERLSGGAIIAVVLAGSALLVGVPWLLTRKMPQKAVVDDLPGYRVVPVPCSGSVHMLTVERALRRGAAGILIVGCAESDPPYREGACWTKHRLAAKRKPALRRDKIDASGVRFVAFNRTEPGVLVRAAEEHRRACVGAEEGDGTVDSSSGDTTAAHDAVDSSSDDSTLSRTAAGLAVAAALVAPVVWFSDAPSLVPVDEDPALVVSVKHRPESVEQCRELTAEEESQTMDHMQTGEVCKRVRPDVRLEVRVDGEKVEETVFEARGLSSDGPGIGTERFIVEPDEHRVSVRVGSSDEPDE
ncbi:MAG: hydrogenase iron-sulfur subunit [Persicimonas sp.]